MYNIYTDGSCTKSRSGWGFVIVDENNTEVMCKGGALPSGTTNQACELLAAFYACDYMKRVYPNSEYIIHSDSAYLINCYTDKWYANWESNGWVNSKKEPVANKELWENLIPFFRDPCFHFMKVKGHAGNPFNEKADRLATGAIVVSEMSPGDWSHVDLTNEKNYDTIIYILMKCRVTTWKKDLKHSRYCSPIFHAASIKSKQKRWRNSI
jgi:ribonuclease HI